MSAGNASLKNSAEHIIPIYLPTIRKKTRSKTTPHETIRTSRKTTTARPRGSKKTAQSHQLGKNASTPHHKKTLGETYVFECTRPGCGYRIWHDEKHEPGQVRFDMKCPKCHNHQFKCLGKGEVPGTFELPVPMEVLDLNNISATELGSSGS